MKHYERGLSSEVIEARENALNNENLSSKSAVSTLPLKAGGSNFKTTVLVKESSSKLRYKPSIGAGLFSFVFLSVGLTILFFGLIAEYPFHFEKFSSYWFFILFGLIFTGAGVFLVYSFYKPIVFDKRLGLHYKTYNFKLHRNERNASDNYIALNHIIAIQIIGEHVQSNKSSYKSFELNLVLKDNTRKNVIDHGDLKTIIDDAHVLSAFLGVPIWHASSHVD